MTASTGEEQTVVGLSDSLVAAGFGLACLLLSQRLSSPYAQNPDYIHIYLPWARELAQNPLDPAVLTRWSAYPPGYPLLLNLLSSWGGYLSAGQWVAHLSFAALAAASVLMATLLGPRWLGWATGSFILLNPVLLWHAGREWADTPAAACVAWALFVQVGSRDRAWRRGALVGTLLGIGYWFRLQVVLGFVAALLELLYQWFRAGRSRERRSELVMMAVAFLLVAGPLFLLRATWGASGPGIGTVLLNANLEKQGSVEQIAAVRLDLDPKGLTDAAAVIGWGGVARHWIQHGVLEVGKLEMAGLPLQWLAWGGVLMVAAAGGRAGRLLVAFLALKIAVLGFYHVDVRLFVDQLILFQLAPFFLVAHALKAAGESWAARSLGAAFVAFSVVAGIQWYLRPALADRRGAELSELASRLDACGARTEDVADLSINVYDPRTRDVRRFDGLLIEAYRRGADNWGALEQLAEEKHKRFLVVDERDVGHLEPLGFFGSSPQGSLFHRDSLAGKPGARLALFVRDGVSCR